MKMNASKKKYCNFYPIITQQSNIKNYECPMYDTLKVY